MDSPTVHHEDRGGTCHERGTPKSDFLFILEALGPDEVALGRQAVGPTGELLNKLLRENTPLRRQDITLVNPVRCRPIAWEGDEPAHLDYNGDEVTMKPSFDQIRECASRYFDEVLEKGEFKYIICLGSVAAYTMLGRQVEIGKMRGTIFEPGAIKQCGTCRGEKTVPGKKRNCKKCKGRGTLKCDCGGVTKHKKKCEFGYLPFPMCIACQDGKVPGKPKKCPSCGGAGEVPVDPGRPHVCNRLKDGQLLMITYHPAYLMRNPGMWPVVERDFQRITQMEKELEYASKAVYDEYPSPGKGIAGEILRTLGANGGVEISQHGRGRPNLGTLGNLSMPVDQPRSLTVDLETTGLDADSGRITHFAFTDRPGYGAVLHPNDPRCAQLLRAPEIVGQNFVLFDWWWLERHGYEIPRTTRIVDTRYLGKLINPDTPNDLPYLTSELADPPLRGYWKAKDDYRRHIERVACIDVDATTRVVRGAWDRLERTGQAEFAKRYIIPISRVVFEARLAGMKVNKERMEEAQERIQAQLDEKRQQLPDWGGVKRYKSWKKKGFTWDYQRTESQHAKVKEYIYDKLKLPVQKNRGTWQVTANKAALETLLGLLGQNHKSIQKLSEEEQSDAVSFLELLMELRDMSKLATGFLRYKYSAHDKVHPELNPVGTATLRPTCADPNILQVPGCKCKPPCHGTEKHKCVGDSCPGTNPKCKNARWVFIPDEPDWEIMSVDLSQAEVIGFLWYAEQWDVLDKILNGGQDAYQTIANRVLGRDASSGERDRTKVDTLAFIYGEAERTQSLRLRIAVEEIRERREAYIEALPGVGDFRSQLINQAMRTGFVESPWGVRRYIRVDSPRGRAANEACNAPIQNICPMVTGHAMIKLHEQLPKPARLWTPWVYDELNFVYPKELRSQVYEAARDILGAPVPQMPARPIGMGTGLKFRLDFAVGDDWGHLRPLEAT